MKGSEVMVWGGIGFKGKTSIRFINGKMKSIDYVQFINEKITTHAEQISEEKFTFQHDNVSMHSTKIVRIYFKNNNIEVLRWLEQGLFI